MKPIEIERINDVQITISQEIKEQAETAIAGGSFIQRVTDDKSQGHAVAAVRTIKELIQSVESARKECKKPFLEKGRELDRIANEFIQPLKTEQSRITGVMTAYTVKQARIRREAEEKRQAEIKKAQEERAKAMEAMQQAKTEAQKTIAATVVKETITETKAAGKEIAFPDKPAGVQVRRVLVVDVVDVVELWKARPDLVDITPRVMDIKRDITANNQSLPGVKHEWDEKPIIR